MQTFAILWPTIALAALSFLVTVWVAVARAGAIAAVLLAGVLAARLANLLAGVIGPVVLGVMPWWLRDGARGNSEGILVALVLGAVATGAGLLPAIELGAVVLVALALGAAIVANVGRRRTTTDAIPVG